MCKCIVQHASSTDFSELLAHTETRLVSGESRAMGSRHSAAVFATSGQKKSVIKPNMPVSVLRQRDGQIESVKVRWGWSPVWAMGTMPPRTQMPLHLVMRSKVFDRVRTNGRVLVPVDGWYDLPTDAPLDQPLRLSYTTSRRSTPLFLAGLAQISEKPSGCDGMAFMTCSHNDYSQRLLAFTAEHAMQWLDPDLQWDQAQHMALHLAVDEPQLEHVLTSPRQLQARR